MTRLILTIPQARSLQHDLKPLPLSEQTAWGDWAFAVYPEKEKADTLCDPERMMIAVEMKARECTDSQIAEQLGWKPGSSPFRTLARLIRTRTKAV